MEENHTKTYPLDSSAMVHLASMQEGYTNTFRVFAALTKKVDPKALQRALDRISPRFPTIVAGIRRGIFQYKVVPVCSPPAVKPDSAVLAYMPEEMIRTCAMRVLYKEKEISVEFFHALTDGYGGLMFVQALLTEYLFRRSVFPRKPQNVTDHYRGFRKKKRRRMILSPTRESTLRP